MEWLQLPDVCFRWRIKGGWDLVIAPCTVRLFVLGTDRRHAMVATVHFDRAVWLCMWDMRLQSTSTSERILVSGSCSWQRSSVLLLLMSVAYIVCRLYADTRRSVSITSR
jgi:hypothetical protein